MKGPSSIRYGNAVAKAKTIVNHFVTVMIIMLDSYCGVPGFAKQVIRYQDLLDDCGWIRSYNLTFQRSHVLFQWAILDSSYCVWLLYKKKEAISPVASVVRFDPSINSCNSVMLYFDISRWLDDMLVMTFRLHILNRHRDKASRPLWRAVCHNR